jgi:competence protein ComEC
MFGFLHRRDWLFIVVVTLGFFSGGSLLSSVEWQRAWRPPLRVAFEALARAERAGAAARGRRMPEDDEAFAIVEGILRADAAPSENGVSLSVMVDWLEGAPAATPSGLPRGVSESARRGSDAGVPAFAKATAGPPKLARIGVRAEAEGPTATGKKLTTDAVRAVTGGIVVTIVGTLAAEHIGDWRAGRRVRMPVMLRRPSRYLNPGVPDFERALARRGTTLVGSVKSGALVEVLARGSFLDEALGVVRAFARRAIAAAVGRWNPRSAAIVTAIVIGDRAGLDDALQRRLQEAGTYHVIAISGGNIAILAGLLIGVFRRAGLLGRTAMLSAIALLGLYAVLVGGGASVNRATLMAVVYFAARAFDQRTPPLNALAVVAALIVVADPLSIADPAFLLTFGATLAIVVVVPVVADVAPHARSDRLAELAPSRSGSPRPVTSPAPLPRVRPAGSRDTRLPINADRDRVDRRGRSLFAVVERLALASVIARGARPLVMMLAASAAAEAMLFPIGVALFSRVTFAGLGLNVVAIPMMALAEMAGLLVVPLALVSAPLAGAAGWIAHVGAAGLVWSAGLVRFVPTLTYRVAPANVAVVIAYYGAIAAVWVLWRARAASTLPIAFRVASSIAVAAALWILVDPRTIAASRGDGLLRVTFIDVGQGDAAFVRFPRGATLLVDTGGLAFASSFDIGDRVVAPVMRHAGFARLDLLALTHGDPDHIGGAASIVSEFRPSEIWEGIPVPRSEPLTELRMQAQAMGTRWANVYAGDHTVVDGVRIVAWHPRLADWERQKVRNDDSIVLDLRWRDVSILLTGDIGREVERTLATTIPPANVRVMKVPHHGSLTSSTADFVRAMRPTVAVVSAGRANHFGHPAPEVVERYRAMGAEIFRTDRDGAVTIETDGISMDVLTYNGRRLSLN